MGELYPHKHNKCFIGDGMKKIYFFAVFIATFMCSSPAFAWFNDSCDSRIQINLTANNVSLPYYVLPFKINNSVINYTRVMANGTDIFCTNATDTGKQDCWIDYLNQTTQFNTSFYINMTNNSQTFYVYYNCSGAATPMNISKVFDLIGEDCEDGVMPDWTVPNAQHTLKVNTTTKMVFGTNNLYTCQVNFSGSNTFTATRKAFTQVTTGYLTYEYYARPTATNSILFCSTNNAVNCYDGLQTDWLPNSGQTPPNRYVHYGGGPSEINVSAAFIDGSTWYRVKIVTNFSSAGHASNFAINYSGNVFSNDFRLMDSSIRNPANHPNYAGFAEANPNVHQILFDNLMVYRSFENYPALTYENQLRTVPAPPTCYTITPKSIIFPIGCSLVLAISQGLLL